MSPFITALIVFLVLLLFGKTSSFTSPPALRLLTGSASGIGAPPTSSELIAYAKIRGLRPLEEPSSSSQREEVLEDEGEEEGEGNRKADPGSEEQVLKSLEQRSRESKGLMEPTRADMKQMAFLLANVSDALEQQAPELALSIASQNMGWLFARDMPALTQMLLGEYPSLRQDAGMQRGYMFLLDFLEAVGSETASMLKKNQAALRALFDAMKVSAEEIARVLAANRHLTSPEFLLYLDAELQAQQADSPMESLLATVKLRLLEEVGRDLGYDVSVLPKLAAEEDPAELRRRTLEHVRSYESLDGQELFLQALRLMRREMRKRYQRVDPLLLQNLNEVEKITQSFIDSRRRQEEQEEQEEQQQG